MKIQELLHSSYKNEGIEVKSLWKQYLGIFRLFITRHFRPTYYYLLRFHRKYCAEKDMLRYMFYKWFLTHLKKKISTEAWIISFANKDYSISSFGKKLFQCSRITEFIIGTMYMILRITNRFLMLKVSKGILEAAD